MKSKWKRLGDYIHLIDSRNRDNAIGADRLFGINVNKEFMPSVANVSGTDLGNYKIICSGQFAYSSMQVGRDRCVRVALFMGAEPALISPAYLVFTVDENKVFSEFLMMWLQRPESDRYGWFISDGSVRSSLEWERFCDIQIPIPSLKMQRLYVDLYNSLHKNQQSYENTLDDLQLACDIFMDAMKEKYPSQNLSQYIQQSDERNKDLSVTFLRGISTSKKLIGSQANINGIDFSKYKIVRFRQFVYTPDTSRRGDKVALTINNEADCIVSPIYSVFYIREDSGILSEYLFLWFKRSEFDRYARYHSWGSVRETFDWDDMCQVTLPVPPLEVQKSIVAIYQALETRKRINAKLKEQLNSLCPILMRGVVESLSGDTDGEIS